MMNKLWPGIIPDVHTRPIALLERVPSPLFSSSGLAPVCRVACVRVCVLRVAHHSPQLRPLHTLPQENIQKYLDACVKMGIRKDDLFGVSDLYEEVRGSI